MEVCGGRLLREAAQGAEMARQEKAWHFQGLARKTVGWEEVGSEGEDKELESRGVAVHAPCGPRVAPLILCLPLLELYPPKVARHLRSELQSRLSESPHCFPLFRLPPPLYPLHLF